MWNTLMWAQSFSFYIITLLNGNQCDLVFASGNNLVSFVCIRALCSLVYWSVFWHFYLSYLDMRVVFWNELFLYFDAKCWPGIVFMLDERSIFLFVTEADGVYYSSEISDCVQRACNYYILYSLPYYSYLNSFQRTGQPERTNCRSAACVHFVFRS